MKKALLAFGMVLMTTSVANAGGLVSKHASSVQLSVDAAKTTASRIGSSFSILEQILTLRTDQLQTQSLLALLQMVIYSPGTIAATQDTPGAAFSFSQSYTQGDAIPTSAPTVGTVGNLTGQTSYTAGTTGDLAGTVTSANILTVTAGGAGSTAIGQFVSEITVID